MRAVSSSLLMRQSVFLTVRSDSRDGDGPPLPLKLRLRTGWHVIVPKLKETAGGEPEAGTNSRWLAGSAQVVSIVKVSLTPVVFTGQVK